CIERVEIKLALIQVELPTKAFSLGWVPTKSSYMATTSISSSSAITASGIIIRFTSSSAITASGIIIIPTSSIPKAATTNTAYKNIKILGYDVLIEAIVTVILHCDDPFAWALSCGVFAIMFSKPCGVGRCGFGNGGGRYDDAGGSNGGG
nr:amidoxime reducing component [Tanacetum cinerariifolium]